MSYFPKHSRDISKFLLTGVSAVTLLASGLALAESARTSNQNDVPRYTEQEAKEGLQNAKDAVSDAAQDVSQAAKETYEDIRGALSGDKKAHIAPVTIDRRMTAAGIIGQPVLNEKGERVAKVKDIILDDQGKASMIVLADGDWTGLGKLAAFDYNVITRTGADGNVIAPLTEKTMDQAAPFSYDPKSASDPSVKIIPQNGYSAATLLDTQLTDPKGRTLAEVDNISFHNGQAEHLIVEFDQMLGLGGKKVTLGFHDPELQMSGDKPRFQLSAAQAKQFEAYKNAATN
ncbi:MAG: PRC-barrel domain-containing protein [Alphaproteobacteria bacterium]|nr:PRC-barrel domain-containing protein [Alphaproteobacteria bacterium]